ncbi:MAG TPA: helix-turn-helix domain-containing protein [Terrimicrobiaceae bacterium]
MACTLDLVGDRWTLLVVRDLILGKTRFEEFLGSPEGIATNILSSRLRLLADLGYITAEKAAGDRRRIHYNLTKKGEKLGKLLRGITKWGLKNLPETKLQRTVKEENG